jgi:MFS family permease
MFFVQDDKKMIKEVKTDVVKEKFSFATVFKLFKDKYVYLHGGIIFMGYAVFWTVYYLGGFLESNVGISAVTVATIMVVVLWMRPVGGLLGGFLADKIGKDKVQMGSLLGATICLLAIALLPVATGASFFTFAVVLLGVFLYAIRGTYWSLLGDYKIDAIILGTAIGVISFIGYLPDIILPQFNSYLWATFGANGGYNAYFISSAIIGLVGVVLVFIFGMLVRKEKAAAKLTAK